MIVRLTGGLGNQLFQYAFGQSVAAARPGVEAKYHWCRSTWDYALQPFDFDVPQATPTGDESIYDENGFNYDRHVFCTPQKTYFRGYWQTEKYFNEPVIRNRVHVKFSWPFSTTAKKWENQIWSHNSVFVHVRRGDYLNPGTRDFHGILDRNYYDRAIAYIHERVAVPNFFLFSDDPNWCRENWPEHKVVSTDELEAHEEMWLMSQCRHAVIANSSFSWWGAWLGDLTPDRIVVAPQNWFRDRDSGDIVPERWVKL